MTSFIFEKDQDFSIISQLKKFAAWLLVQNFNSQNSVQEAEIKELKQIENNDLNNHNYLTASEKYEKELNSWRNYRKNVQREEAKQLENIATINRFQLIEYLNEIGKCEEFMRLFTIDLDQARNFALDNGATPKMWISFNGA